MMRINSVDISNYRQHRHSHFEFPKKNFDMHLILAENGVGKTNIMNAISWCLYEKEPYSDSKNKTLPICNQNVLVEGKANGHDYEPVSVKLNISRDGVTYEFLRSVDIPVNSPYDRRISRLTATIFGSDGNSDKAEGEEARRLAEMCFPPKIRDYIFFDSEQLSSYFDRPTNDSNIKDSINEISQINALNQAMKHLKDYIKDCTAIMSKNNPKLKEKQDAVDVLELTITNLNNDIEQLKITNKTAKDKIEELNKRLNGNENVASDNKLRDDLTNKINALDEEEKSINASMKKLISKYYVLLSLYQINKDARSYIRDKEDSGQLPSSIDPDEIRRSLENHECSFCKSGLTHTSEQHLKALLDQFAVSTKAGTKLVEIKNDVDKSCRESSKYSGEIDKLKKDRKQLLENRETLLKQREEVSLRLSANSDVDSVTNWFQQKKEYEDSLEANLKKIGRYETERDRAELELKNAKEELAKAQKNSTKCEEARANQQVAREAMDVIALIEKDVSKMIRTNMEIKTKEWFDNLVWKNNSFQSIRIDENYNVELIDKMGMSCLGSCSAAEHQLLALAFTLALHEVSGHDSMLFIDTPVGRVSGDNRTNFAKGLVTTSIEKQVILTVTSSEFSEELRKEFTPDYRSSMVKMVMDDSEKEVKLEEE